MSSRLRPAAIAFALALGASAYGQSLTLPPSGDNQKSRVTQQIGPVNVTIEYSSPRVVRGQNDRRGQIWGKLVPYGLTDLGFNDCKSCPWRAGANENTVFTTSHDVKVQGQPLPAGTYGLHMIAGPEEWTVIFSKNATSWGSYFYDPKEDALRVTTKSGKTEYHEWLSYEFTEREPAKATLALKWEDLQVPFTITVDNAPALWVESFRKELRGPSAFDWHNYDAAAQYALRNKVGLPDALAWADRATKPSLGGEENFQNLMTLSRAQAANGKDADAAKTMDKALAKAGEPVQIHQFGRQLLAEGKKEEAMKMFLLNAKRFPNQWPVHLGLARGYAAMGDNKKAIEEAKLALPQAPDDANRKNLDNVIKQLQEGKKID